MGQRRNKTGIDFEYSICESLGWQRSAKSPRIKWSGEGRSNFKKIQSVNFDPTKFYPIEGSIFHKYDAITPNGDGVEIKKYNMEQLKNWTLYSEPIFKVASENAVNKVVGIFGDGDYELAVNKYNKFIDGVRLNVGQDILDNISNSNIGIELEDGFISQSNLEYRWVIVKGWMGFNRLSIEFRIKNISWIKN